MDQDVYRRLLRVREDVRRLFEETRIRDRGIDDIDGKSRLERVPAFSHRNFDRLRGADAKLARKEAARIADFMEGVSELRPQARAGLRPVELDKRIRRCREGAFWRETAGMLRHVLEDEISWDSGSPPDRDWSTGVRVASLATFVRQGYDPEGMIRGVNDVYRRLRVLSDLPCNAVGSPDKWDDLMRDHSGCIHVLLDGALVGGYWMGFAISDGAYATARSGGNINEALTTFDVEEMALPGRYRMYLVDLFVRPEYREAGSAGRMLRSFTTHLSTCARHGLVIERVVANVSSFAAERLALRLGFRFITDHRHHLTGRLDGAGVLRPTRIYELDLLSGEERPSIFDLDAELELHYRGARARIAR